MIDQLRDGDTIVDWRLDRLGRSLGHLIKLVEGFEEGGVGIRSLNESLDTTTSGGKLIFSIFGALAEFERSLIQERTNAGLAAARARGRMGGRPTVMTPERLRAARKMIADSSYTISDVAAAIGVSRQTIYRSVGVSAHGGQVA